MSRQDGTLKVDKNKKVVIEKRGFTKRSLDSFLVKLANYEKSSEENKQESTLVQPAAKGKGTPLI